MAKESNQDGAAGMPVPSHLAGWVVPKTFRGHRLTADVRCPCGSERLEFHYPGQTHLLSDDGMPIPCTAEIGGEFFFVIKAVCAACCKEQVLFDMHFHGCNGFLEHDATLASLPRPRLWPWRCLVCGSAAHNGEVTVILDYKQRYFAEGYADRFGEDRWPDAYGCFGMGLRCCGCGHETPVWVDYETR
jgi:hypothetical protein